MPLTRRWALSLTIRNQRRRPVADLEVLGHCGYIRRPLARHRCPRQIYLLMIPSDLPFWKVTDLVLMDEIERVNGPKPTVIGCARWGFVRSVVRGFSSRSPFASFATFV